MSQTTPVKTKKTVLQWESIGMSSLWQLGAPERPQNPARIFGQGHKPGPTAHRFHVPSFKDKDFDSSKEEDMKVVTAKVNHRGHFLRVGRVGQNVSIWAQNRSK